MIMAVVRKFEGGVLRRSRRKAPYSGCFDGSRTSLEIGQAAASGWQRWNLACLEASQASRLLTGPIQAGQASATVLKTTRLTFLESVAMLSNIAKSLPVRIQIDGSERAYGVGI
jgi:hypothetical protein